MPITITYFVHGTTTDNEAHISSGWSDCNLSSLGRKQSIELKDKIKDKKFDVVFCSDLKRAVNSTKLTFGNSLKIIQDKRLRECNYGELNGAPSEKVDALMINSIDTPFPKGESYKNVQKRMQSFLEDLKKKYSGKHVAIVAHRAPQLALDVILKNKSWKQAMEEDWRIVGKWQPGWEYQIK